MKLGCVRTRRRARLMVTMAVVLSTITHFAIQAWWPTIVFLSPLAGLGANLLWIWVEDIYDEQ